MVFFARLGKIGRSDKDDKDKQDKDDADVAGAGGGGGSASSSSAARSAEAAALPAPASRKKTKEGDQSSASGGGGSMASAAPGERRSGGGVPTRAQAGLSVNDFISKTKNQQRQGVKPSGPELIAYARYLGIDPVADHDLLWIAVEALEAPLPSDWTEHFDSADRVFYYNATTRVSSWTHPMEQIYRDTYKTIVTFRNASMSPQERNDKLHHLQTEVKQMEHDVHKEIARWTEHTDEQGNRFYFNREEKQSTWTDPRPAKCQVLYLRMKMLRLLLSGSGATSGIGAPSSATSGDAKVGAVGGSDSGGNAGHSRFAPLGGDFDEPDRKSIGGSRGAPVKGSSSLSGSEVAADRLGDRLGDRHELVRNRLTSGDSTAAEFSNGRNSPISTSGMESPQGSDSESDEERKGKRRKKKKKKKKRRDQDQVAMPPVHPGSSSSHMGNSQSEPSIGKHLGGFEQADALSNVGRERVKAGIRLEPIGSGGGPGGSMGSGDGLGAPGAGGNPQVPIDLS
eukprot:TRINITY_DN7356_c0_g2_i1.p1 TRINITY_DN7356_c0_g2~~TRINITY_DN7356_c0_g2_i1.p1  ORF type:complete len:510 (+),score=126.03 TRINITY_DN7356_c0_g2_i1:303-1832(+)